MRPQLDRTDAAQRFLLLATLYFVQGVPFGLFVQALPVVLRQGGTSFEGIGLSSLLALPWALKFLWAPWVDANPPVGPRRKGWILPLHAITIAVLLLLMTIDPVEQMPLLLTAIFVTNFLNATQDIATDGLAVDLLPVDERGIGNALQVGGYRVGMIFGGAGALLVIEMYGWRLGIAACIVSLIVCILPLVWMREPAQTASRAARISILHFFREVPNALRFVILLVAFKFGDALSTGMLRPILVDYSFSMADIGVLVGGFGFVFALAGALTGGLLADRFSRSVALFAAVILQTVGASLYLLLVGTAPTFTDVAIIVSVENFMGGIATVVLFTCMMDWTRREHTGADYTVFASVVVMATGLATIVSGFTVANLGLTNHFAIATTATLIGGLFAVVLYRRTQLVTR